MAYRTMGHWGARTEDGSMAYDADTRRGLIAIIERDGGDPADYSIERNWYPFSASCSRTDECMEEFGTAAEAREHEAQCAIPDDAGWGPPR